VSRRCLGARKPEICAFVGITGWLRYSKEAGRRGVFFCDEVKVLGEKTGNVQGAWLGKVNERYPHVFEKADGYCVSGYVERVMRTTFTFGFGEGGGHPRCMPSSSEDLTFANITSEGKGRKTVNLKTTMILDQNRRTGETEQLSSISQSKD